MSPSHYLYPLNPKAAQEYHFEDDRGNRYPTSVEGFFDCYANQPSANWGIYHGANDLEVDDFIWVHFALPVSAIMAVGRVRSVSKQNDESGRYTLTINWDWKLTKRLQTNPIPFAAHRQRVPISVRKANDKTVKVIEKWLKGAKISQPAQRLSPVTFKQVLVEQRQGQSDFRQVLMVAYDNQCAVTGCDVRDTLQAAHIVPVSSKGRHHVQNGLLLRADIHNLFDRGLLTIDDTYTINLHHSIRSSVIYKSLHGKKLAVIPAVSAHRPSTKSLVKHKSRHSPPQS